MKTKHQLIATLFAFATLSVCCAQSPAPASTSAGQTAAQATEPAAAADWTEAEVRRVDLGQQKLTLKHGEIKNLDMPPMTMVFSIKAGAPGADLLPGLKPGDKIRFKAEMLEGKTLLTAIQR